jgi:hypothetical protein
MMTMDDAERAASEALSRYFPSVGVAIQKPNAVVVIGRPSRQQIEEGRQAASISITDPGFSEETLAVAIGELHADMALNDARWIA